MPLGSRGAISPRQWSARDTAAGGRRVDGAPSIALGRAARNASEEVRAGSRAGEGQKRRRRLLVVDFTLALTDPSAAVGFAGGDRKSVV